MATIKLEVKNFKEKYCFITYEPSWYVLWDISGYQENSSVQFSQKL